MTLTGLKTWLGPVLVSLYRLAALDTKRTLMFALISRCGMYTAAVDSSNHDAALWKKPK